MQNRNNTNKAISGFLIDPESQTVTQVDVCRDEYGSVLKSMYDLLGCSCVDFGRNCLSFLPSESEDDLWFDDEGLYPNYGFGFQLPGSFLLAGRGLILGYNDEGDCISSTLTQTDVDFLKKSIIYHRGK